VKIAWFTPFAKASAIGKYGAVFIRELRKTHDVTIFADNATTKQEVWLDDAPMYFLSTMPLAEVVQMLPAFDAVFYNMGNYMPNHARIYEVARAYSGIVILHDLVMHHFFRGYYLHELQDSEQFLNELTYSHGREGRALGESILDGTSGDIGVTDVMLTFNMALSAIRNAHGVITHSRYSNQILHEMTPAPIAYIPFPTPPMEGHYVPTARKSTNRVRLLTFGILNPNKLIAEVIQSIGLNPFLKSNVTYELLGTGESTYVEQLKTLVRMYKLENVVNFLGYQPDEVLHQSMVDADIIINLRNPQFGESSASLVEGMMMGKPVVVWNHGYYATFPDETVMKVDSQDDFVTALTRLVEDKNVRLAYGQSAQAHIQTHLVTAESTRQLVAFAEDVRKDKIVLLVTDFIIDEMRKMGADERFPHLSDSVIKTLSELII